MTSHPIFKGRLLLSVRRVRPRWGCAAAPGKPGNGVSSGWLVRLYSAVGDPAWPVFDGLEAEPGVGRIARRTGLQPGPFRSGGHAISDHPDGHRSAVTLPLACRRGRDVKYPDEVAQGNAHPG